MLCCIVLCSVVLCCVVLYCDVLCCIVLCCNYATYMALGLRLMAVLPHDLLECDVEAEDLGHDVYTAHDNLVEVTISDEIWCL